MSFEDDVPRDPSLMQAAERRFLADRRTLYGKVDLNRIHEAQQAAPKSEPQPIIPGRIVHVRVPQKDDPK